MKTFRAIYNTNTYKGIKYDFKAKNMVSAKTFADSKFNSNVTNLKIVEIND